MYTTRKTEIAKLRAYLKEAKDLYVQALNRRDLPDAKRLHESVRRVQRAILLYEEFHVQPSVAEKALTR